MEFEASVICRQSANEIESLSVLSTGRLTPQEISLVLISVRGLVASRDLVGLEELDQ